jgi:hypothetical protein
VRLKNFGGEGVSRLGQWPHVLAARNDEGFQTTAASTETDVTRILSVFMSNQRSIYNIGIATTASDNLATSQ